MTVEGRPILLLLVVVVAGLLVCGVAAVEFNVTLFSRVTLIRQPQSTSDLDHFHPRALPCSRVKSHDDPISGRRGDSTVPYSFIRHE